ncbi:AfsR/SARP family transcriptional regulator [Streptomyces zagrosensis]|uniref:Putative ATPase/DNA-binding SARP family transcriptional activator n=1 Tax=Streptomyces zagrosensis TaxID=1042984 RepID=A0A7W9UWC2_9ACTN|nr:AfsR/SARP family transcriptional regulator [Streptomyces zagrosensis]MBB5933750.1 putative ATPase/DNA-binding SARP family transcriptional activator [Streptomyces zagrosensis]
MRYLILGVTEAYDHRGQLLPAGGPRLRALLTSLALHATRPASALASVDVLIGDVWGDTPPHDAPAALQALVGRLRRNLGKEAVQSAPGGYRLTAAPDDIDLAIFEQRASAGGRALDAGDAATAATLLRDALALWRGPALADLPDREVAAARADALRLTALHQRIEADLALGRKTEVIPELRELVAQHPLDEPFHAQLLRALRAADRSADALAAYEVARHIFAERLGADPGSELRHLHAELLAGPPRAATAATAATNGEAGATGGAGGLVRGERSVGDERSIRDDKSPVRDKRPVRDNHREPGPAVGLGAETAPGAEAAPAPDAAPGEPSVPAGPSTPDAVARRGDEPGVREGRAADEGRSVGGDHAAYDAQATYDAQVEHGTQAAYGDDAAYNTRAVSDTHGSRPDAATDIDAVRSSSRSAAPRGNLRARLTSFVGRRSEIRSLRQELHGARLVTLTGPGGSGKTRLSEETAATVSDAYPDGVWIAELAPLDSPAAVSGAVLSAIGRRDTALHTGGLETRSGPDATSPTARLVEQCAHRKLLLLLDNCEHVIEAAAELTETLLTHCPGVTVLATSREPLGVPGETVRPVEPLAPAPAHQLFAERAAAARPGFDPAGDRETAAAVAEICRRLDGLPLAIELAAARLRMLSPRQIADRLDDRFRLLTSGSRTVLPRQQTLRAVVDWSWDLLDERERTVLLRASFFAGSWDLPAAETVCADDTPQPSTGSVQPTGATQPAGPGPGREPVRPAGSVASRGWRVERIDPAGVLDLLGALVDKSLLVVTHTPLAADGTGGDPRYRMLETIHEYVTERVAERALGSQRGRAERDATARRHAHYFRDLAQAAAPRLRSAEQLSWLRRVETDLDNFRAALHRCLTPAERVTNAPTSASQPAIEGFAMGGSPVTGGPPATSGSPFEDGSDDLATAVDLVFSLGWFWWLRNYRDEGAVWVRHTLAFESAHHEATHRSDGDSAAQGNYEPAPAPAPPPESESVSEPESESEPWSLPPGTAPAQPEFAGAPPEDDPAAVARYWQRLDLQLLLYFLLAEQRSAEVLRDPTALAIARAIRDAYGPRQGTRSAQFPGLMWPFAGYLIDGHAGVLPLLDQAVVNCRTYGDDWALGVSLMFRTHMAIDMPGGMHRVDRDWAELRAISRRVGDRWMLAQVEEASAEMAAAYGRYAEARASYREALRLARELGAYTDAPFLISRLAELAFSCGDPVTASKLLDQSEEETERFGGADAAAFNGSLRAAIALLYGDVVDARARCDQARVAAESVSPPPQFSLMLGSLEGRICAEEGDVLRGLRSLRDTLASSVAANCTEVLLAHAAESTAYILAKHGTHGTHGTHGAYRAPDPRGTYDARHPHSTHDSRDTYGAYRAAAQLLGAADGWRGVFPRSPLSRAEADRVARAGAKILGDEEFASLRAASRELQVADVVKVVNEVIGTTECEASGETP